MDADQGGAEALTALGVRPVHRFALDDTRSALRFRPER